MRNKKIILIAVITLLSCYLQAQHKDVQQIFVAISEEEVYDLYNQMLDSARLSNWFLYPGNLELFGVSRFKEIESKDTLMKFVQRCDWQSKDKYICDRFYRSYISNNMPIDFYERFLKYLEQLNKIENYFIKEDIINPLYVIRTILINQYESGKLNKEDSIKARGLIEEIILRLINDDHNYRGLIPYKELGIYDKYMTDKIHQALINVIENPFYPTEYLDFYMSKQDTLSIDTVGIPNSTKEKIIKGRLYSLTKEDWIYYPRFSEFLFYKKLGEEWGGLSSGQAYLKRKRDEFREKGYLPINYIEEYAYQKQDKLLIKHLKGFKKKHPDYPLKYF